jgi:hypothetical protein
METRGGTGWRHHVGTKPSTLPPTPSTTARPPGRYTVLGSSTKPSPSADATTPRATRQLLDRATSCIHAALDRKLRTCQRSLAAAVATSPRSPASCVTRPTDVGLSLRGSQPSIATTRRSAPASGDTAVTSNMCSIISGWPGENAGGCTSGAGASASGAWPTTANACARSTSTPLSRCTTCLPRYARTQRSDAGHTDHSTNSTRRVHPRTAHAVAN